MISFIYWGGRKVCVKVSRDAEISATDAGRKVAGNFSRQVPQMGRKDDRYPHNVYRGIAL